MNNQKEAEKIINEISDINETAILALERVNGTESIMISTVLKQNRYKINELIAQINPEEVEK